MFLYCSSGIRHATGATQAYVLNSLLLLFLLIIIQLSVPGYTISRNALGDIPSVFPHRLNYPGLQSPKKAWWAKEITPDFHVSGRLSERQIKFAAEAGFKSIVSLFTYPTEDLEIFFGDVPLPNTVEERRIVEEVVGLQFFTVLDPMDEWASVEAVAKFTALAQNLKKPALLHCDRGYTIAFVVLLYMANQTRNDKSFEPKIHSKEFFDITAVMGLDFFSRIPLEIISEITGEALVSLDNSFPKPNVQPAEWLDYWLCYPIYQNWFIAGQIYRSHVKLFKDFEYNSIVNIRLGLEYNENPSQEEVNLLNIDISKTYGNTNTSSRQSDERLKETKLNPNLPNSYISNTSLVNYERINEEEFGDTVGYNSELEEKAFEKSGINYYHMPFYFDESLSVLDVFFEKYKDDLLKIGQDGPVLVHCTIGLRAATVAVLTAAIQYHLSLEWALQRLKELGFGIKDETYDTVYRTYAKYLKHETKTEL